LLSVNNNVLYVSSSGNVLIGNTIGDGYRLQIVGSNQATSTFGQTYAGVAAYSQWISSSNAFVMGFDGAAGTTARMTIAGTGNIGIGTTSPGNRLAILGADETTNPTLGTNAGKFGIFNGVGAGTYGMIMGVINNGNSYIQVQRIDATATAYNLLLQPSGGSVGIGIATSNPSNILHIAQSNTGNIGIAIQNTNALYSSQLRFLNAAGAEKAAMSYVQSNNGLYFWVNGDDRMIINSSGHVTTPAQPSFLAVSNQGAQSYTSGQVMVFNLTRHNIGSHYNTSNSRFTAPTAGRYLFSVNIFTYTSYDSAIVLTINGSQYTPSDVVPYIFRNNFGGSITVSFSIILELSASDYVEVRTRSGSTSNVYMGHSHFSGHLLG
jgi:hypothetical protein